MSEFTDDRSVYLCLRGEDERWNTSIILSREDAHSCLELLGRASTSGARPLPSVDGMAELQDGQLRLTYNSREIVCVEQSVARQVVGDAIEAAEERQLDMQAHDAVWDWIAEKHEPRVLVLEAGQKLEAVLLYLERTYLAAQSSDGTVWFVDAARIFGKIWMGEQVTVAATSDGLIARPSRR